MKRNRLKAILLFSGLALCIASYAFIDGQGPRRIFTVFSSNESSFVARSLRNSEPLSQLIDMAPFSEMVDTFHLEKPSHVQIYAVGEILYNMPESEKRYYLKSDDIDLFFDLPNDGCGSKGNRICPIGLNFSMATDKEELKRQGNVFKWKKKDPSYTGEIKIPWKNLNLTDITEGLEIKFDLTVGDNDDNFVQESKIAWSSTSDDLSLNTGGYGTLRLTSPSKKSQQTLGHLLSIRMAPEKIDGIVDSIWQSIPAYPISNVVYGYVKDRFDLSATVRSCWDNENLYFLLEITDSKIRRIYKKDIKERQIFVDHGWIENEKGEKVWEMNAKSSRHAGGALKNQLVDTLIYLERGRYTLKYVSDESHSFNKWNDDPPNIPFYGIVLYEKQPY